MRLSGRDGHLTYCTNIHRGETWADVWTVLQTDVLGVRHMVAPKKPFGVGLRLSGIALGEAAQPDALTRFKDFLVANDLYVFTLNAFPYGPFHGTRVKEQVYLPDWQDEERLRYSNASADFLAAIMPASMESGSVSTVPGAFKSNVTGPAVVERMADLMIRHVAHLVELERRTGRRIALAIEPEPCCFLETTPESIAFFEDHLFARAAADRLAALTGLARGEGEAALRRHVGLCLDLCHAAVEFEEPAEVYATLRAAGVGVPKLQISAGLRLPTADRATEDLLKPFDDGVYLHQVIERVDGRLNRYPDLGHAFASLAGADEAERREWRVHYHVPVFLDDLGPFSSTQSFLRDALALHKQNPISDHLEVETYTWGVLPDRYRTTSLVPAIARELQWVQQQLAV